MATAYENGKRVTLEKNDRTMHAAGGIITTPVDLARWLAANINRSVLPASAYEEAQKGQVPMETTRGDRLFIGLLSAAYVNLAFVAVSEKMVTWFGLEQEPSIWISFVASMLLLALVMRKG
jgi:predicted small integral membrane protein